MTFTPGQEVSVQLLGVRGDVGTVERCYAADDGGGYVTVRLHQGGTVTAPIRYITPVVDIRIDLTGVEGGPA